MLMGLYSILTKLYAILIPYLAVINALAAIKKRMKTM